MAMLCVVGVVLCVPAVLLRGVSCVAGEQLTLTRYLPPTPAPAHSQPAAAGNSSPLATRRGGAATAARRSPPRPPPVAPHGHITAALHRAAADLTADSRHLVHCEQLDKIHQNYSCFNFRL